MGFAMIPGQKRPISITRTYSNAGDSISIEIPSSGLYVAVAAGADEFSGYGVYCAHNIVVIDNYTIIGYSGFMSDYSNTSYKKTPTLTSSDSKYTLSFLPRYSAAIAVALYKLAD